MSKHTPGPWVAELDTEGSFSIEADGMGIGRGLLVIASRNQHPLLSEEMHANARLIAAAPDLLDALYTVEAFLLSMGMQSSDAYQQTAAAIAKATGETNA